MPSRSAAFLDRDGVLIHDDGFIGEVERVRFIAGAASGVRLLNAAGYFVFVVTNQSAVARGLFTEKEVASVNAHVVAALAAEGAHIDDLRYCPHHPEGIVESFARVCECRKPKPGMILDLMQHWPVEREGSFLIGDRGSDLEAARAASIEGLLFKGGDFNTFVADFLSRRGQT